MNICNLIEIMESYGSVRIEKKFSGDLIFVGNSFEVPENFQIQSFLFLTYIGCFLQKRYYKFFLYLKMSIQ